MISRQLSTLLHIFDRGEITERSLSYLLALHTMDVFEKKISSKNGYEVTVSLKGDRVSHIFTYYTLYYTVKAALMCQRDSTVANVKIRPTFTELNENGSLLIREWVSVGGDLFTEIKQHTNGKPSKSVVHVLNLPLIPA